MSKPNIICIDDQREVLATLRRDLTIFTDVVNILDCESAEEALELIDDIETTGEQVCLFICDHIMPGSSGVDFLIGLTEERRCRGARKLLLTGLATHQDTILAINRAHIDHYIEKPWSTEALQKVVRELATSWLLENGFDHKKFQPIIDSKTLLMIMQQSI